MKKFKSKRLVLFLLVVTFIQAFAHSSYSQSYSQKIITGTVTDESGQTLIGVTVMIKGTYLGTITDVMGNYSLSNVPDGATLVFSFVGMITQEIPVGTQTKIDITLLQDAFGLEEVVVVGYGSVRKVDLTGAVGAVSSKYFENQVNASLDDALKGRLAGVQITSNDGAPGGSTRIRIRGNNTITGSGEPLFVVDGVPIISENYDLNRWGETGSNPISYLNPADIESVQVLKDASSTAIYGARGSNGVILITTKGGDNQRMTITLDAKNGASEIAKKYDLMNTKEHAYFRHYRQYGEERWLDWESWADSINTDWQDEMSRIAILQDYNFSIRGSDANTSYSANIGWFNQEGIIISSDFSRVSARLNLTQKLNKKLRLTINTNYSETSQSGIFAGMVGTGLITQMLWYQPYVAPYSELGELNYNDENLDNQDINPLVNAQQTKKLIDQRRLNGKLGIDYNFGKYLVFNSSFALNNMASSQEIFWPATSNVGKNFNGRALRGETTVERWIQDNILTYNRAFNENNYVNVMIGSSAEKSTVKRFSSEAFNFPIPVFNTDYLESATEGSIPSSFYMDESLLSFLSRINYNYKQKYYITASIRADGSSHFGANNKWGYFPSGALKWRINNEEFLKGFDELSDLSLRLSYGVTGNQAIPAYQTLAASNTIRTYFSDQGYLGLVTTRNGNPDLKWESTYQYNAGLDIGFLSNRISMNFDAYYKITKDMLLMKPIPSYTGFISKMDNIGSIENKGIEVSIQSFNIDKQFKWETQFNFALNRNKVLDLGGVDELILDVRFDINTLDELILQVGKPIGQWYGYVNDGLFTSWEDIKNSGITNSLGYTYKEDAEGNPIFGQSNLSPGMEKFKDISGPEGVPDGIIDSYDRTVLGSGLPLFTGAFGNNFYFKNFSLGITLTYSYGAKNFNANLNELANMQQLTNNIAETTDFFIIENPADNATRTFDNLGAKYPSPHFPRIWGNRSRYISDASFIRLSNVVLGYELPRQTALKLGVKTAKVFLTGNNLHVWTKYTGYDPEVATGQNFTTGGTSKNLAPGLDYGAYPASRSISLGLNVTF